MLDLREARRTSEPALELRGDDVDPRLIVHPDADQVFVEQYRRLGAALHHAHVQDGIRGLMVASAVEGEGKTLCATNLALSLSQSFAKRVLLVDADLRKPSIHQLLRLDNGVGLSDCLTRPIERLPLQIVSPQLSVMTAGRHQSDPVPLFVSDALGRLLAEARERFDWVIVDTPPVMLFPDAGLLAGRLDTCVMVVGAETTKSSVALKAIEAIGASRIAGVALNRAELSEVAGGYDYGQYKYARGGGAGDHIAWWRSGRR